ncbi:MAG: hypothetical protein U1E65_30600 [Myxococcota bacterium]
MRTTALLCSVAFFSACGSGNAVPQDVGPREDGSPGLDATDANPSDATATDAKPLADASADAAVLDAEAEDQGLADAEGAPDALPVDGGPSGIGPNGGVVLGPGGAEVIVPAGALSDYVDISVTTATATNPSFPPAGVIAAGLVYQVLPHGTTFAQPVTLHVPYEPSLVPAGARVRIYRAEPGGSFAEIPSSTIAGSLLEASVTGFSYFAPGSPASLRFSELTRQCARESLGGDVWCWAGMGPIASGSGLGEPPPRDSIFREPTRLPPRSLTHVVAGSGWVCGIDVLDLWCIGDWAITRTAPAPNNPPNRQWVQKALPTGVVLGSLTAGGSFACGLGAANSPDPSAAGQVFCWGDNTVGQLGRPVSTNAWEVLAISSTARYVALAAAGAFACAAREGTGEVDCWGSNIYGGVAPYSLGSFDMSATPIPRGIAVAALPAALGAGALNACGLAVDGTAYCWGDNSNGQMGNGTWTTQNYRAPSAVPGLRFSTIWPSDTMCGIALDGQAYCWGYASQGSLGNGHDDAGGPPATSSKQLAPVPVAAPLGVHFEALSIGESGRCGKTTTNEIYCWGSNRFFNLGTGSASPAWSNVPVRMKMEGLLRMMP